MNHLTLATNVLSVQSLITVQKYKNYHYWKLKLDILIIILKN